ncbi:MAG: ABC transporter substrate-binding protein [Candidatus Heimdallarchaeota archaeon]
MKRTTLLAIYAMALATLSLTILLAPAVQASAADQPSKEHLKFEMITLAWDTYSVDAGYAIAEALEEIGIEMEVKEMDDDPFYTQVYEKGYYDEYGGNIVNDYRDYETYEMSGGLSPWPTDPYFNFHSANDYPWGSAHSWLHNDSLDDALDDMMSTTGAELKSAMNLVQKIAAEQLPIIPLFISSDSHVVHKDWTGFVTNPGGILTVWNIWTMLNMSATSSDTEFDMAYPSPPSHFNPFLGVDARSGWVYSLIWEPLIRFDEDNDAIGWLAESFTRSADGLSVDFVVRDGVTWHDGEPLNATDVKFSLDLYASDEATTTNVFLEKIASVTIGSDNKTVTVTRTEPQAWTAEDVGTLKILPKHIWEGQNITAAELDDPAQIAKFVGSGPFEYTAGAEGGPYTFTRNDNYWYNASAGQPNMGTGSALPAGTYPKAASVKITVVSGESNRVAAIQNGDADSERYENSMAYDEAANPNVKVIDGGASRWDYYMIFNTAVKPLDDLVVRRAIAHAIDKDAVGTVARGDYYVRSDSIVPESFFPGWYNPATPQYTYSIATANEMLDDAGYEDVDNDGVRDIPGWEEEDSPGFEWLLVFAGMLAAIPLIRKRK